MDKRTNQELVVLAFDLMIRNGDAKRHTVEVPCLTGGCVKKTFYKVEPTKLKSTNISELIDWAMHREK